MKVALISFHSFVQPGGVKRHVLGLYKEYKKRGIETKIIVPRRKWKENYGKDVILLGTSLPINFVGSQSDFDINFNPISIEKTLRKEKFDVLHFHNFGFPSALQILASSATADSLKVLTLHSDTEGSDFFKTFPGFIYFFKKICQWKINGVIGVAPMHLMVFRGFRGPRTLIPNGIDLDEFNTEALPLKKFPKDGKINILFVGRIEERKGLIYLLKAYNILQKRYSNLRLIVVGDGPLKNDCENYVKENKLMEVYFEGRVGKELPSYYKSADIFVSPAIFGESFGLVLLEAMACGVPVVAFANSGYRDLLGRSKVGKFLVRPKNYQRLASTIGLLVENPSLRKNAGEWGIEFAKKYSWEEIAGRVLDFYQSCKRNEERKPRNSDLSDKILVKLDEVLNVDILDWLKKGFRLF